MSGQIVPALDLRAANDAPREHAPLANIEAEQALIGAVLYQNDAFERIPDGFTAEHFYEPFHGRLWAYIARAIRTGKLADPILLETRFKADPAFEDLGGIAYLAMLVEKAPPPVNAPDYAEEIIDLANRRRLVDVAQEAIKDSRDFETPARDLIERAEGALFNLGEVKESQGLVTFGDGLARALEQIAEAANRDGSISGLSTGLADVDQKTGGVHPSDLIILAARPSMGKSSLALNIAFDVARKYRYETQPDGAKKTVDGGVVAFFSLEMSVEQLDIRILADVAAVDSHHLRQGQIEPHEFGRIQDAAQLISEIPLYIDATGGISLPKLAARARRLKRTVGLDLIVIDYLQLMTSGVRTDNRVQEISTITVGLKALAKDLGVPVLALSQLSRAVEQRDDKKPQLSDLRESGSIEQDADVVMFLYREEYYLGRQEPKDGTEEHFKWQAQMDEVRGRAELIIGKQRHGPIGTIHLAFNEKTTKFSNLARDSQFAARNPYGND